MKKKTEQQEPLKILAGRPDRPLQIGDTEIPCYVLEGEIRVLSQGSLFQALGRTPTARSEKLDHLPAFLAANNLKPFISNKLKKLTIPILFRGPRGRPGHGYQAIVLPEICNVYLDARRAGVLLPHQLHIAEQCELLMTGFAHVGIIALIDEATGYQEVRAKRALAKILEEFIDKQYNPWTKTFGEEFSIGIAKLRGWEIDEKGRFPRAVAGYINNFVYARLEQGVLDELRKQNLVQPNGRRQVKHDQWLTRNKGYPHLQRHLWAVMAFMRVANSWGAFKRNVERAFPVKNENLHLPLDEE